MLFSLIITILHVFDCFEDHTRKKKKKRKFVTRDVTNFSPINLSKPNFQFESIWMNPGSGWFGLKLRLSSNSFELMPWNNSKWIGLSRVDFWRFFIKRGTKHFWIDSKIKNHAKKCSVSSPQCLIEYYAKWLLMMRNYPGEIFGLLFNPSESELTLAIPESIS